MAGPNEIYKKVVSTLNPKNWGVTDYSNVGTFSKAYQKAKLSGEKEFMYNGERKSTNYAGTPEQEISQYGVNGKKIHPLDINDKIIINEFPMFHKDYLPGHLEAGKEDGSSISYGLAGNAYLHNNSKNKKTFYAYGSNPDTYYKKYQNLQDENRQLDIEEETTKKTQDSSWNLFKNNCADNVIDSFGIKRKSGLQTPSDAVERISQKYPVLEVTGRTPDEFKQKENNAVSNIVQPYQFLKSTGKAPYGKALKGYASILPIDIVRNLDIVKNDILNKGHEYLMNGQHHSTVGSRTGVQNVQNLLNLNGYKLEPDGVYGPKTKEALLDYQSKNNK